MNTTSLIITIVVVIFILWNVWDLWREVKTLKREIYRLRKLIWDLQYEVFPASPSPSPSPENDETEITNEC